MEKGGGGGGVQSVTNTLKGKAQSFSLTPCERHIHTPAH